MGQAQLNLYITSSLCLHCFCISANISQELVGTEPFSDTQDKFDGITVLVGMEKATDVIYVDFSKEFDMDRHNILLSKLDGYVFNG